MVLNDSANPEIVKNKKAQQAAKKTMEELCETIRPGMSEKEIETFAIRSLEKNGSNSWWYHGVGALVLLGDRSTVSVSGREYYASEENILKETDVVTIDLAPTIDGYWGDYARTLFVEEGRVYMDNPASAEFKEGVSAEISLHKLLTEAATPDMTFQDIFEMINAEIDRLGFVNLDYRKNLGHTIEEHEWQRLYIEEGNNSVIGYVAKPFTFEPHIKAAKGKFGFKREDIYYFDGDRLAIL
ncbi:MAG: aminopeptidase P family protein [Ruminococcaceae bacterium]|nr:aminopeptidase P family protein [Oscillospiraceae bacterium]